jgi:hypothetical protein
MVKLEGAFIPECWIATITVFLCKKTHCLYHESRQDGWTITVRAVAMA